MKISELAKRSNLTTHALRYYETRGLIKPTKSSANNYRQYSDEDLTTVRFITRCTQSGFSLDETAALLQIKDSKDAHVCAEAKAITRTKRQEIQANIERLKRMEKTLEALEKRCCGGNESAEFCSIIAQLEAPVTENNNVFIE